jgi:uncharacterized membrane protein YeaQ/YmgE (transglycosylase-associated protein family)
MSWLWAIIIGFLAGALAKFIMPGKDPKGCIITTLLGIGGALIFTAIGRGLGIYQEGEAAGFIGAVLGAIVILALYRMFLRRK